MIAVPDLRATAFRGLFPLKGALCFVHVEAKATTPPGQDSAKPGVFERTILTWKWSQTTSSEDSVVTVKHIHGTERVLTYHSSGV